MTATVEMMSSAAKSARATDQTHLDRAVTEVRDAATTLDLAPRGILRPAATDDAFVRFMRRRGLSPHDASLRVYEAHLQPGVPVALVWHRSPEGSGPVLSQAPREL